MAGEVHVIEQSAPWAPESLKDLAARMEIHAGAETEEVKALRAKAERWATAREQAAAASPVAEAADTADEVEG